ncbi:hypothetical protein ECEC1737_4609, partial [Escherichia coli EC1737]|jgi:hypothetical protein
MSNVK